MAYIALAVPLIRPRNGIQKCIVVIERKRFFTLLCTNAGSYSDMACIHMYMILHEYMLQIWKLCWNRYLCSCTVLWKNIFAQPPQYICVHQHGDRDTAYLESQWKYTELQVVYNDFVAKLSYYVHWLPPRHLNTCTFDYRQYISEYSAIHETSNNTHLKLLVHVPAGSQAWKCTT